jgi:uncharacterized protein
MPESQQAKIIPGKLSVLITGGSGLVGRYLTSILLSEGYSVSHLSRNSNKSGNVRVFQWDTEKKFIETGALEKADYIIHLAGANIGEKRWTKKRKREIVDSRVESARFLYRTVTENKIQLKAFISGSAVGYYGSETSEKIYSENDPPSAGFLGNTCRLWEEAADLFALNGTRVVKIRTAVVLEKTDSALSKLLMASRFGFLVQTGNGRQYMPWIHINDLCNIYLKAIKDQGMNGAFNAVSPIHISHRTFMKNLSEAVKVPVLPIHVPAFLLRLALGEMSDVILKGSRISSDKIISAGYQFLYPDPGAALENITGKSSGEERK